MEADEKYIWIQDDEYEYLPGKAIPYLIYKTNKYKTLIN